MRSTQGHRRETGGPFFLRSRGYIARRLQKLGRFREVGDFRTATIDVVEFPFRSQALCLQF